MPTDSLITVIVPIYNAAPFLDQCLNSITSQTYAELEILCLNDGSTDDSLSILRKHAEADRRIRIINKDNEGYGATCNRGLTQARGAWISVIEPDDWIEPEMFKTMVSFASSFNNSLDIVKTPYWRIWMPDTPEQRKLNCSYRKRIHPPHQPFSIEDAPHLLTHHPSIWSALYSKSFLSHHHISFREYPGAGWADNPFLIETLCQAQQIAYLDTPFYCYREETPEKYSSFARNNTLMPFERWNDMMDLLEHLKVENDQVLRAHNSRGFTYLGGIANEVGLSHPGVRDAACTMFSRMNPQLVLFDPEISPGDKRLYCELTDTPLPKLDHFAYLACLIRQGLYNLTNVGLWFSLYLTSVYLRRKFGNRA